MKNVAALKKLIDELRGKIPFHSNVNAAISSSSVGWHIEHTLLTINSIIRVIGISKPEEYKWSFKPQRVLVFTMNKIPRGRAKSPERVTPKTYTEESMFDHIIKTQESILKIESLSNDKYFEHPIFGHLKLKHAIKFLLIHTRHHLHIINDIISTKK